ncbi:MAG: carbohydrate ABC transporter substrate-binding protein [Spirochaetaceae bacterium]|nr:MAG: carbohydrate ABC transporter substrate-binding protein [Spirochaetaceae bacterium]
MKKAFVVLAALLLLSSVVPVFAGGGQEAEKEIVLQWPCIWVAQDSKAATVAALVDQFNADNAGKIKVVIEPNPDYDGYRQKINTMMAAGQVPDLFVFNPDPTSFTYYQGDLLMDFTDDLKGAWGRDFAEGTIATSTRDGRTKSIPYELGLTPIWYNTELFKKAGISEFPKTFDEFWVACDKLKAIGVTPTSQMTGGTNAWTSMLWYSHIMASIAGPEVWSKPLSDPAYVQAAELLKRLYADGNTTKDAVGCDPGCSSGHYLAQDTAIFINGPWYIGAAKKNAPEVHAVTAVAPAPAMKGGKHGGQIGFLLSNLAAANTYDPARRAAVIKFMKWMTAPDNVKKISMDAGSLFCVKFSFGAGDQVDPLQQKFIEASANAAFVVPHFQFNYKTEVVQEFGQALGAMALGRATPQQFVEMLQAKNR